MTLVIPNVFQDGDIEEASGVEVNENFAAVKAAVDALEAALAGLVKVPTTYTVIAETGFGAGPLSSSRPAWVNLRINKPVAPATNDAIISVGGVVVGVLGMDQTSGGILVSQMCSFILPANKAWVLASGNLAACQPVEAYYALL